MDILAIASLLLVAAALFGAVNHLVLKLPSAIGILVVALVASFLIIGADAVFPWLTVEESIEEVVLGIEFSDALLEGMLGLLLFAGALHVKVEALRREWLLVLLMATIGVGLSTAIAGVGFSWLTGTPILVALVFGALISPTDPVAVLGVLRAAKLPKSLETKIAGESLFNDGVGYVVFLVLVGIAFPADDAHGSGLSGAALLFAQEAFGGALLGAALGFVTFRIMRRIDDPPLEVLITLALAFGGYQLSLWLHVSAPIMAVVAGLLIGDVGTRHGMSAETRAHVDTFWTLVDEILNAVLFLLIGIEVFAVAFDASYLVAGLGAIVLHLVARFAAVAVPVAILKPFSANLEQGVTRIMTWGGLKGGISVALVLALPENEWKPLMLTACYMVVLFSIIVQGLTVAPLARRLGGEPELDVG
ncbi:sodium:proton antiporter [Jannaschia sp. W003]|uniref:cation:proton antiporter n=1 Tax=Jannaschia sp. W003 TaxID=2867012 RepID=UPI0021A49A01|nr:sodium:proton antiporter [Jannaschia sp. W003]UWQ20557.1 sodium:proton antiporter [Jannaschia sp. W003]